MKFNEYQKEAKRTVNKSLNFEQTTNNMVFGIIGETGEVVDVLKKHLFQGHELNREKLTEELGDLSWYIANLCTLYCLDWGAIAIKNVDKLHNRYPDGFSRKKSVSRTW